MHFIIVKKSETGFGFDVIHILKDSALTAV